METRQPRGSLNVVNAGFSHLGSGREVALDFAYLAAQTFGDKELEDELLTLFLAQARRLIPGLGGLDAAGRAQAAHLLKGSARAIGAVDVAAAADAYETDAGRHAMLLAAFAETEAAIEARFASRRDKHRVG